MARQHLKVFLPPVPIPWQVRSSWKSWWQSIYAVSIWIIYQNFYPSSARPALTEITKNRAQGPSPLDFVYGESWKCSVLPNGGRKFSCGCVFASPPPRSLLCTTLPLLLPPPPPLQMGNPSQEDLVPQEKKHYRGRLLDNTRQTLRPAACFEFTSQVSCAQSISSRIYNISMLTFYW